jgi:hypothetical protein
MMFQSLPFAGPTLNTIGFHPRIVAAAEQLLGTDDLRLTQSLLRATYGGSETVDQFLHRDFVNNTLLTPPREDGAFGQLPVLVYLTDVGIGEAPTYLVSKRYSDDRSTDPTETQWETKAASVAGSWAARSREDDPELYAHEVPTLGPAGTALFYSMRTWHRGSASLDRESVRIVHHAVYRRTGYDWMDFTAWPPVFDTARGQQCIAALTPRQRRLLGIPAPGHPFWTPETIAYFGARYPGADIEPYLNLCA